MTGYLVLADIDGTFVDPLGSLWPEVHDITEVGKGCNCVIALCSARPNWSVLALATELGPAVQYAASFQGALVSRRQMTISGSPNCWTVMRRCALDFSVAEDIEKLICSEDSMWWYTDTEWRIRSVDEMARCESQIVGRMWNGIGLDGVQSQLLKVLIVRAQRPELLLDKLVAASLPLACSLSQPGYVEIVHKMVGGDKGAALIRNLEHAGESVRRTVAIGDGLNDLGMFSAADASVTFDDAPLPVREAADIVLSANRHNALRQFANLIQRELL